MSRLQIFIAAALVGMVAWIVYAAIEGNYLKAVAISCIGPVLAWFALGAGKVPKDEDED